MKCPTCGFVSFAGIPQCKKCGHWFASSPDQNAFSLFADSQPSSDSDSPGSRWPGQGAAASVELDAAEPEGGQARAALDSISLDESRPGIDFSLTWRGELTERIQKFRRRRARRQRGPDSDGNLDFDFERPAEEQAGEGTHMSVSRELMEPEEGEGEEGGSDQIPVADGGLPALDSSARKDPEGWLRRIGPSEESPNRWPLEGSSEDPLESLRSEFETLDKEAPEQFVPEGGEEPGPLEIDLGDSGIQLDADAAEEWRPPTMEIAAISKRFVAGLLDAGVLFISFSLFALIFGRAGGHLTHQPVSLAILGSIPVLITFVYFGLMTNASYATPGLLWMGLEVRRQDGGPPNFADAWWRAFGYLVSLSSLGLGFVWSAFDSDSLTWHDRMSGTLITSLGPAAEIPGDTADSEG